jgi:signal transduction histidine kinase
VNEVKSSFKEGVSIETMVGDNIGGGRGGSIHDNNDNNKELKAVLLKQCRQVHRKGSRRNIVYIDNKRLEIQVTDSGIGIAEDILPNLFGRFVTRDIWR